MSTEPVMRTLAVGLAHLVLLGGAVTLCYFGGQRNQQIGFAQAKQENPVTAIAPAALSELVTDTTIARNRFLLGGGILGAAGLVFVGVRIQQERSSART